MSSRPKELVITLTLTVNEPKEDRQGVEELYLRCATDKVIDVLDIAGRGKFHIERKIEFKRVSKKRKK